MWSVLSSSFRGAFPGAPERLQGHLQQPGTRGTSRPNEIKTEHVEGILPVTGVWCFSSHPNREEERRQCNRSCRREHMCKGAVLFRAQAVACGARAGQHAAHSVLLRLGVYGFQLICGARSTIPSISTRRYSTEHHDLGARRRNPDDATAEVDLVSRRCSARRL